MGLTKPTKFPKWEQRIDDLFDATDLEVEKLDQYRHSQSLTPAGNAEVDDIIKSFQTLAGDWIMRHQWYTRFTEEDYLVYKKILDGINRRIKDIYKAFPPHARIRGAAGGALLPNGTILGGGTGAPSLGGLGSIGGSGHGFGGGIGGGGPNTRSFHGIPGMGGFGKRAGDDEGGPGAPGVHGSGFQGNFGNGFFGSGFLHPGIGLGGGLTGGGSSPSGGGLTGKHKTGGGSGTTGGSYVDANTRNDARGSGSDRDRGGSKGSEPTTGGESSKGSGSGGADASTRSPSETRGTTDPSAPGAEPPAGSGSGSEKSLLQTRDELLHDALHRRPGSKPSSDGGGDTGGNASESRPTFTGYHPAHGGPAGAATIGVGVSHLPGSPISYITATSDVGGVGGTTEGFGGTNPNVRVYRPDPEASGGSSGPRNPYLRPSDEAGSPRGPGARIAGQGAVASTGVRARTG